MSDGHKLSFRSLRSVRFLLMQLKEVCYAHYSCIYLVKNTVKTDMLSDFKKRKLYFKLLKSKPVIW